MVLIGFEGQIRLGVDKVWYSDYYIIKLPDNRHRESGRQFFKLRARDKIPELVPRLEPYGVVNSCCQDHGLRSDGHKVASFWTSWPR